MGRNRSNMQFVVHLWGSDGIPSVVSPESVALFWFLNNEDVVNSLEEWEVVFSNNTDLSPTGVLPLLVMKEQDSDKGCICDKWICGFSDIAKYVMREVKVSSCSLETMAMLQFLSNEFQLLTLYQLYLNKANYVDFTRGQFSKLLYWPMWYSVPLKTRSIVRAQCDSVLQLDYLPIDNDDENEFNNLSPSTESNPTEIESGMPQSGTFKLRENARQRSKDELISIKHGLQFLNKLYHYIEIFDELKESLPNDASKLELIAVKCFFTANVSIQINLPSNGNEIKQRLIEKFGSKFINSLESEKGVFEKNQNLLNERIPYFQEEGNVMMSIFHKANKLFNMKL